MVSDPKTDHADRRAPPGPPRTPPHGPTAPNQDTPMPLDPTTHHMSWPASEASNSNKPLTAEGGNEPAM